MGKLGIDEIQVFHLKRIPMEWGDVLHGYKRDDQGLSQFEEVYFSWVKAGTVRDWKLHRRMTMNLIVQYGMVRFVFHNDDSEKELRFENVGDKRYVRLSVPPGIWFSFRNAGSTDSLLVNMADILHDPQEMERKPYEAMNIDWGVF